MPVTGALPEINELSSTADPKIRALLNELKTEVNSLAEAAVTSRRFKPTIGYAQASSGLSLTSSFQDIVGASLTITPEVASKILILTFMTILPVAAGPVFTSSKAEVFSTITVDSESESTRQGVLGSGGRITGGASIEAFGIGTASQGYVLSLTAAAHTIKMRARSPGGAGTVNAESTGFLYMLTAS